MEFFIAVCDPLVSFLPMHKRLFSSSLGGSLRVSVIVSSMFSSLSNILPENYYFSQPNREMYVMAQSGEYGDGEHRRTDDWPSVLDMSSVLALGIVEMRVHLATADIPSC
jgi:hypothetical protein